MFFKVLSAMLAADAFDRRQRQRLLYAQQQAGQQPHSALAPAEHAPLPPRSAGVAGTWDSQAPERPC
jgi:hypothetical protein